ncbi:maoC like domain protein [Mycobacterium xenopi 3993]|nr:maoC like domain protein [Mycobacterium xenopi 3993]
MTYRFVVEEGKIAEFAAAVGDDNPAHRDREAAAAQGFPAIPAPLTFCASSALWYRGPHPLAGRRLDLTRVLHGETEIELCRPLLAGDELIVEPTFAGTEEKQGQRAGGCESTPSRTPTATPLARSCSWSGGASLRRRRRWRRDDR